LKTVLVTGATGFIGSALNKKLIASGYHVAALTHNADFAHLPGHFLGDLRDRDRVGETVAALQPELVFHLAADKNRSLSQTDVLRQSVDTNFIGTLNLVEACLASRQLERFIFLGTCEEYGGGPSPFKESQREMPISPYSLSKLAVTNLLQAFYRMNAFPGVVLRPTLAYGPGQGSDMFLPALIRSLLSNQPFAMSNGDQTRDFIFIDDLIDACLAAVDAQVIGRVINIGSGYAPALRDVALLAAGCIGKDSAELLRFGALPDRTNEIMNYSADISLACDLLAWKPRTALEEGMKKTVDSYRNDKNDE
jgi:nucleoside-diphosphate-sugar epimerase